MYVYYDSLTVKCRTLRKLQGQSELILSCEIKSFIVHYVCPSSRIELWPRCNMFWPSEHGQSWFLVQVGVAIAAYVVAELALGFS